jgi:hypothetical protein
MVFVLIILFAAPDRLAARDIDPDPVRTWNELALRTVRTLRLSDAQAARLYAMVNVAMYDAVNGIVSRRGGWGERAHALVPGTAAPAQADPRVAAAAAAHAVLVGEHSLLADIYNDQLDLDVAAGWGGSAGQDWGAFVGTEVLALRTGDGSTPPESQPGVNAPGQFPIAWSGVQFRNLKPFAIASSAPYVGSGPPALESLRYATAFAELKVLGNSSIVNDEAFANYTFWSLGTGTAQPPGAWIQVALAVTAETPLQLPEMTRLFALLGMAMSDTVAPTVMTKYVYHSWRPATAINRADTDGNVYTEPDSSWSARAGAPGASPEYWSGHSTFSAAAAAALSSFFCADDIPFELTTDSAPSAEARSYASFSAAAEEAGQSRLDGGVHFRFSHQDAQAAGRAIAAEIAATSMLRRRGPTHYGRCPL